MSGVSGNRVAPTSYGRQNSVRMQVNFTHKVIVGSTIWKVVGEHTSTNSVIPLNDLITNPQGLEDHGGVQAGSASTDDTNRQLRCLRAFWWSGRDRRMPGIRLGSGKIGIRDIAGLVTACEGVRDGDIVRRHSKGGVGDVGYPKTRRIVVKMPPSYVVVRMLVRKITDNPSSTDIDWTVRNWH